MDTYGHTLEQSSADCVSRLGAGARSHGWPLGILEKTYTHKYKIYCISLNSFFVCI